MDFSFQIDQETKLMLPMPVHAAEILSVVQANLAYLQKWMPWATNNYSIESALSYIRDNLQQLAHGTGFNASIVYENKICGQIGFHEIGFSDDSVKMGYWIAANRQGRGIVTKCSRAFINHAFNDLQLNRVQINCNTENFKSRRIPERLGFKLMEIRRDAERENNDFTDWAIYEMLKQDWKS